MRCETFSKMMPPTKIYMAWIMISTCWFWKISPKLYVERLQFKLYVFATLYVAVGITATTMLKLLSKPMQAKIITFWELWWLHCFLHFKISKTNRSCSFHSTWITKSFSSKISTWRYLKRCFFFLHDSVLVMEYHLQIFNWNTLCGTF